MDKNAIKKYAVWARRELIERVSQRAMIYGITAKDAGDPNAESVNGHLLSQAEKRQRQALIRNIKTKGYEQVMEEVAYTWFNRFAALRFMEVNGYLPSHIRVFTNDAGEFKPQILAEAIHLELDGLDMNKVYELESANKSEELFKYLLIVQCNALNSILPGMFQRIEDYTELLLPDYLLREGSVIEQMVTTIPEEDWTDQVQIIGWLYQYYNTEPKDKVFADLKKNIKITKENIPAATQLFTPDWIVHYMVENSLGRLWLEGHSNDALKSEWKYYLDEAEQEPEVQAQIATIRKEYAALKPEEIRVIDPCMGSGHILCVLFDVLVRIYEDYGYTSREAAVKIVENNLWGLDIDERAAQLSYFAVMMKARQYDRRFFTRKVQPHVYAIEESNGITSAPMHDMGLNLSQEEYGIAAKQALQLVEEMHDAKEYGSIIHVTPCDWNLLRRFAVPKDEDGQLHLDIHGEIETSARLQKLINIGETLAQKYEVVVTNPPYMGSSGMDAKLTKFVKETYSDTKSDLSTVFMERNSQFCSSDGFISMINIPVWMFLTSYDKLRVEIINHATITNMAHFGRGVFGSDFGTTAFVLRKRRISKYGGLYLRLFEKQGGVDSLSEKEKFFFDANRRYVVQQENYLKIPSAPITYWVSENFCDNYSKKKIADYAEVITGMTIGDNNKYLRLWYELPFWKISVGKESMAAVDMAQSYWIPYSKGGQRRNWYGNYEYVVNWSQKDNFNRSKTTLQHLYLKEALTWPFVTMGDFSARFLPQGFLWDVAGSPCFFENKDIEFYTLGLLCSKVANYILRAVNPTINVQAIDIARIPLIVDDDEMHEVIELTQRCIEISKIDWDSFETSWNFDSDPIVYKALNCVRDGDTTIAAVYESVERDFLSRFDELKGNEERINSLFIRIYGLDNELTPDVEEDDVTVRRPALSNDIRRFISYAVGCMFGRYALGHGGLAYAGGEWVDSQYTDFQPDKDAIIPICDDEYFEDDIVGRFVKFVEGVFGKSTLEENLRFISDALGGKGSARDVIRTYFIEEFYKDHCAMCSSTSSGKRPYYWLFDSGKKNGFKCLIYMHRYQPDTIARIRTDYVHEQQSRYRTAIADLEQRINGASTSERVKLSKQLATLQAQAEEIRVYEEKIHHLADQMIKIDLDDGVKHNYEIFKDVLAKIK